MFKCPTPTQPWYFYIMIWSYIIKPSSNACPTVLGGLGGTPVFYRFSSFVHQFAYRAFAIKS